MEQNQFNKILNIKYFFPIQAHLNSTKVRKTENLKRSNFGEFEF